MNTEQNTQNEARDEEHLRGVLLAELLCAEGYIQPK